MKCINRSSAEYQILKQRSGLSDVLLSAQCAEFEEKYGRWPHLDELYGCDSSKTMSQELELRASGSVDTNILLSKTGLDTLELAKHKINDIYRDQETNIIDLNGEALVISDPMPTKYRTIEVEENYNPTEINDVTIFNTTLSKLNDLYGIQTKYLSADEIEQLNLPIKNAHLAKGFIYNGEIYINTTLATVDTPLHELSHLLIGSIRFQDPNLYMQLLEQVTQLSNFQERLTRYKDRTRNDAAEEVLVSELSKYLTGLGSDINTSSVKYELLYNIGRVLDVMLKGQTSAKVLQLDELGSMTLKQLAERVNSAALNVINPYSIILSLTHRKVNNVKHELLSKGKLKEIC